MYQTLKPNEQRKGDFPFPLASWMPPIPYDTFCLHFYMTLFAIVTSLHH